jgi:DNA helicase-2/ATP-dependent DNA helicase PcrA
VTRAKERLYLLRTFRRTLYGESEVREPSRFLHDIPSHLVQGRESSPRPRQASLDMKPGRYLGRSQATVRPFSPVELRPREEQHPKPSTPGFETGDQVRHEVFGQGVVIECKAAGDDWQVTVAFAGVGLKRLMASMAPMEKLETKG